MKPKLRKALAAIRVTLMWLAGGAVLAGILLHLAGSFRDRIAPAPVSAQALPPLPEGQRLEPVERVSEPLLESFPGGVRAIRRTLISARITASVNEVLVRPGDKVSANDPLVVLDQRELQTREQQARESLSAAEARRSEAEAEFDRMSKLLARKTIDRRTFEAAEAGFRTAQAATERLRQAVEEARILLTYAEIRAPFDAVVSGRFAEPGDVAAPGVPLLTLYDPSHMRLEAFVRESLAVHLELERPVDVSIEALDAHMKGRVVEIVPQADAGSRSFLVKVELPQQAKLFPGLFGRLLLPAGERQRLLVPEAAIERVGQLHFVRVGEARARRLIVPGAPATGERREVLSGLRADEQVLVPVAR